MLGYMCFFVSDYGDLSHSDLYLSYLDLHFKDFYQLLLDNNVSFRYVFYSRPFDINLFDTDDDEFIFSVKVDSYGL